MRGLRGGGIKGRGDGRGAKTSSRRGEVRGKVRGREGWEKREGAEGKRDIGEE